MYARIPRIFRPFIFDPPLPAKWIITALVLLVSTPMAMFQATVWLDSSALARQGATVTGTVIDRERVVTTQSNGDGGTREVTEYVIEYRYDPGRGDPPDIRTGRQVVSEEFYSAHPVESDITVHYLPDDRSQSAIDLNYVLGNDLLVLVVFGAVAALAWFIMLLNLIIARWLRDG